MNKYLLLATALSSVVYHDLSASDTQEDNSSRTIKSGKVTNVITAENSVLRKYLPKRATYETFQGFMDNQSIRIDGRAYKFMGGAQYNGFGKPKVLALAKDVLPSSCTSPLPIDEVIVNLQNKCMYATYKYPSKYPGYSYTFTAEVSLEDSDLEQIHVETVLNKFIPSAASRGAFHALKSQPSCLVDKIPFNFVHGKIITKDAEEITYNPVEVLPSSLPANYLRSYHQLMSANLDATKNTVQLTYQYEPAVEYTGPATHFSFTVETPGDAQTHLVSQMIKIDHKAHQLYDDIIQIHQNKCISDDNFGRLFFDANKMRLNAKKGLKTQVLTMPVIEEQFKNWSKHLIEAQVEHQKTIQKSLLEAVKTADSLTQEVEQASFRNLIDQEDFLNLLAGISGEKNYSIQGLTNGDLQLSDVLASYRLWKTRLEILTSPLHLMLDGKLKINIFKLGRENPNLNIGTDSIDKFIPGFSLASAW